ncbi:MAG: precorrin-6y C5,15-methyltransferase (decarboxylating) subunit CbiE, partial [Proteobacteria bacterium]|nr:precorrin-6y C5,15-methyltransferase (decarboxylating) subunit CbiE [Pseudomonadota bacterium]
MSGRWLTIVGIGDDGLDGLSPNARAAIDNAEILVGGARHLEMIKPDERPRITWTAPLGPSIEALLKERGKKVCVLATGDPMWFGIGATLLRHIDPAETLVIPGVSSFSLAASRIGWPLQSVECLTLHGRPLEGLRPHVLPGNRLLILSADGTTPAKIARYLVEAGFGESAMSVLSHLAGPKEEIVHTTATAMGNAFYPDLNLVAVDCQGAPTAAYFSSVPGLPDDAFHHDGQITKREVRAITLAALGPMPDELLWDVGAGCGSIAVEWMRAAPRTGAIAIEKDDIRLALINANALTLGTPGLEAVLGSAPDALEGLAPPDAVFIGGGLTETGMIERCWEALKPNGRIVANAVSLEGETVLISAQKMWGGELVRLAVDRMDMLGDFRGWNPLRPVVQWR